MDKKSNNTVISLSLNVNQYKHLENLSSKSKFTGGKKLSHAEILRCLIRLLKEIDVKPTTGIKNEKQLLKCLLECCKNYK